ncbi:extracellular solute-binding protein [Roseibium sp. M-1]
MSHPLKSIGTAIACTLFASAAIAQETTISVTATPSIFAPMFQRFVDAFEAENSDISIDLTVPPGEQREMIQDILRRAVVNDLPDVTFQGYDSIRTLADRGLTVPLNEFIANEPNWTEDRFAPSVAAAATLGDTVHGLGVGISFPVLYYNVDLVRQVQDGDAAFPDSWEGVVELAREIGELEGDVVGGFHRFHPWMFQAQVESRGGSLMSADESEITFTGPEGQEAFALYRAFAEAGQGGFAMTREQARQAFAAGTVGILTDSSSVLKQYQDQIGDTFEIGVAPFPVTENGTIPAAGVAVVMMTKDEDEQKAAWRFMQFVASLAGQTIVAEETAYVPANAATVAEGTSLAAYFAERPLMDAALRTVPRASAWYSFSGENTVKINDVIYDKIESVLTLQVEPEEGLNQLGEEVTSLLPN